MTDQLTPQDLHNLAVQKMQLENAQLKYEIFVHKLFTQYQMTEKDQITADGKIVRQSVQTNSDAQ